MKKKICYILPEYNESTDTHLAHIYDFLRVVVLRADVFLIIEKGERPSPNLGFWQVRVQRQKNAAARFFELPLFILQARLAGVRYFYIHYSFIGAFVSSLMTKILGGQTFYWNCGLPWQYKRPRLREFFERLTYRLIDYLVTGTKGLAEQYSRHYLIKFSKIKIMPNWIDLKRFNPELYSQKQARQKLDLPVQSKIVLFLHRLSERKGAHFLPEIFKVFINKPVYFLIAGEGPLKQYLQEAVEFAENKSNIKIIGQVSNQEVPWYLAACDLLIIPSEEEGFPRILLEAMAMARPFVAFAVGGIEEIVSSFQKKTLAAPGDVKNFIKIMQHILNDPQFYQECGQKGLSQVQNYSLEKVVNIFLNLFE